MWLRCSRTKFQRHRQVALFYPPESNANAMTASHATMTSAVTAPAVIFAFSLNVYSRIVSAKTSDNESRGLREDIHSRHRIRKEIVLVVRVESCDASHGRHFGRSPAAAPSEPKGFASSVMLSRVGARSVRLAVYWPCAIFGLAILNGSDDLIGKRSEEEPSGVWRKVGPQRQAEYEVKRDAG